MIHVIIPCGAKKAHTARPHPSSALYQGPYFQACRDWARSVAGYNDIRIVSARHGFAGLEAWLEPYDTRFGREGSVSIDELVRQGKALPWRASAVILLGGVPYVRAARHTFAEARALADKDPRRVRRRRHRKSKSAGCGETALASPL